MSEFLGLSKARVGFVVRGKNKWCRGHCREVVVKLETVYVCVCVCYVWGGMCMCLCVV